MASPKRFDPIAIAVEICNKDSFKTDVFSALYPDQGTPEEIKSIWDGKVEALGLDLLANYNLKDDQQEKVIGAVFLIALRTLEWIEYYAGTFNFTRDFCIEFLEESLFTSSGIIDNQRVQAKMIEKPLNNLQKYQLACFFCDEDTIPKLFNNLSIEDKKLVYNDNPNLIKQPAIIKFWSYYLMDKINILIRRTGHDDIDQFRIKTAIVSGSQFAINYCLEKTQSRGNVKVDIAASIFRQRMFVQIKSGDMNIPDDWIIFRKERYKCSIDEYWLPHSFLADIFFSLFVDWSESEIEAFWNQIFNRRFIKNVKNLSKEEYANLLEYFLCWPHKQMFFELLNSSWKLLPFGVFAKFLHNIVKRIEPKNGQFLYGEVRFFDYREMLMNAWEKSPMSYRGYMHQTDTKNVELLLESIFNLETFNERDEEIIMGILREAPDLEKRNYMLSNTGFLNSIMLLEKRKFKFFKDLVYHCFFCSESCRDYSLRVIITKAIELKFFTSLKNEQWDEAEAKLNWSGYPLTEEDIVTLKDIIMYHDDGMKTCIECWKTNPAKADNLILWSMLPSEVEDYKRRLILSDIGHEECRNLCIVDSDEAERFVRWCLPPVMIARFKLHLIKHVTTVAKCKKYIEDDTPELAGKIIQWCYPDGKIRDFKKYFGHTQDVVTPSFISAIEDIENCTDEDFPDKIYDWKPLEKIFSWCFDSDPDEEKKYKETFLRKFKTEVIYRCIESNNWNAADRFLSWLKLDENGVMLVKKEQIRGHRETVDLLKILCRKGETDPIFINNGGKQKAIERFIHWFLLDDGSTVQPFIRLLNNNKYDIYVLEIIRKLEMSNDVKTIIERLKTF